jgi:hypothetical protein
MAANFRVCLCERATGIVCNADGSWDISKGPVPFVDFDTRTEAEDYCRLVILEKPEIECGIYDSTGSRCLAMFSEVVGHHPLRAMLGSVDTDDGETFIAHLLDAGTDDTIRLLQRLDRVGFGFTVVTATPSWMVRHFGCSLMAEG